MEWVKPQFRLRTSAKQRLWEVKSSQRTASRAQERLKRVLARRASGFRYIAPDRKGDPTA